MLLFSRNKLNLMIKRFKNLKHLILSLLIIFTISTSKSQNYLGYTNSNYAGVNGIDINPSYVVDSRYSFDMILYGFNVGVQNNLVGVKGSALRPYRDNTGLFPKTADPLFDKKYIVYDTARSLTRKGQADVMLNFPVLNFMISKEKWGIALTTRFRTIANMDGLSNNLSKLFIKQYDYPTTFVNNITAEKLNISAMSWGEVGVTFGRELIDNKTDYLKFGVRPKLIVGAIASYARIQDFKYQVLNKDTFINLQGNFQLGFSDAFSVDNNGQTSVKNTGFKDFDNYGWGVDLGFTYEWRPDIADYDNPANRYQRKYDRTKNKYKAKFDLSILDIGAVKFNKGQGSRDFDLKVLNTKVNNNILEPKSIQAAADTVTRLVRDGLATSTPEKPTFVMPLPTAIVAQADYAFGYNFYANATLFGALQFRNRAAKVHEAAYIALTPRWDYKWAGIWLPLSYNSVNQFMFGTGLRLGPLVIGTNNILPLISKGTTIKNANIYSVLRIPILYGKGRKKKAEKPAPVTIPVISDTDHDSIPDNVDKCPLVFGVKALNGCPDKDGDLITDSTDACPDNKGLAKFKGCPDTDSDSIIDKLDKCPTVAGLDSLNGCPFIDNDKDGLRNERDLCPDLAGPKENSGCPWPDADGDKVLDKDDACPKTPGTIANKGCPEIKVEERKIIEKAFSSLEFATGKDIIKPKSLPSLSQLATLLKNNPAYILKLSGHTDNQGKPELNMLLSEKRAKAVQKFLILKGAIESNIIAEWFGQTMPIADNKTPVGRQKNRRVEMKIQFQ
jgi:outer membrane protein OmpA-like peptidoglycan-associated protein